VFSSHIVRWVDCQRAAGSIVTPWSKPRLPPEGMNLAFARASMRGERKTFRKSFRNRKNLLRSRGGISTSEFAFLRFT